MHEAGLGERTGARGRLQLRSGFLKQPKPAEAVALPWQQRLSKHPEKAADGSLFGAHEVARVVAGTGGGGGWGGGWGGRHESGHSHCCESTHPAPAASPSPWWRTSGKHCAKVRFADLKQSKPAVEQHRDA